MSAPLEQFREAVQAWKDKVLLPLTYSDHDKERHAKADHLLGVIDKAGKVQGAEPVAWVNRGTKRAHVIWIGDAEKRIADRAYLYAAPQQYSDAVVDVLAEIRREIEAAKRELDSVTATDDAQSDGIGCAENALDRALAVLARAQGVQS